MPVTFNPFTGNFDLTGSGGGGGASYIDGEVATYNDLPLDGTAALDSAWLVRSASGSWLIGRKPAGIYIRTATAGVSRDADYTYAGIFPDVFSDANFTLYDDGDTSKNLKFQLSGLATGTTSTLTVPASGTIARLSDIPAAFNPAAPGAIGGTTPSTGSFTDLSASNKLSLPSAAAASPAAGDLYRNADTLRYRDSSNTERILLSGAGNLANLTDAAVARTNLGLGSASDVTFGSLQNTPIGSTTRNTGAFTTLNANNGTQTSTAFAPALTVAQTWNTSGHTFSAFTIDITQTAAGANSTFLRCVASGNSAFEFRTNGNLVVPASGSFNCSGTVVSSGQVSVASTGTFAFTSGVSGFSGQDTFIRRDAASTIALRDLANPQTFRIYNTTDAGLTNHERLFLRWNANVAQIGTEKAGTGSARALEFLTDGTTRLTLATTGAATFSSSVSCVGLTSTGGAIATNNSVVLSSNFTLHAQAATATLECTNNPSGIRLYGLGNNTSANIERLHISTRTGASYFISTQATGTGTVRALELRTNDVARLTIEAAGGLTIADANDIAVGTTTGTKIGTATTQKIGFFNATPVAQRAAIADATDAATTQARLNDLLAAMRSLGLIAT